jgi:hypothetical protein
MASTIHAAASREPLEEVEKNPIRRSEDARGALERLAAVDSIDDE